MDLKPFPSAKLNALLVELEKRRPKGRAVAALDADGTLWNTDLGEALFDYQVRRRLVPLPEDPWGHYNWMKENVSHEKAYLWLAQINKGIPLSQVRAWAEEAVNAMEPIPVFSEMRTILQRLRQLEVEVYIVTASIKWAVEPGARRLGLNDDQVIGIETFIEDERVTERQKGIITYRQGKVTALLDHTTGTKPYFCAGNTEGDQWLIESATDLHLVMSAAPEGSENFATENTMLARAQERGWFWHRYL